MGCSTKERLQPCLNFFFLRGILVTGTCYFLQGMKGTMTSKTSLVHWYTREHSIAKYFNDSYKSIQMHWECFIQSATLTVVPTWEIRIHWSEILLILRSCRDHRRNVRRKQGINVIVSLKCKNKLRNAYIFSFMKYWGLLTECPLVLWTVTDCLSWFQGCAGRGRWTWIKSRSFIIEPCRWKMASLIFRYSPLFVGTKKTHKLNFSAVSRAFGCFSESSFGHALAFDLPSPEKSRAIFWTNTKWTLIQFRLFRLPFPRLLLIGHDAR